MSGGACAEFIVKICCRGFFALGAVLIDYQVVQRRDAVIRLGRNVQRTLHIPDCMCVFSDTDPGMEDESIRMGAQLVGLACVLVIFGLGMVAPLKGTILDACVLSIGVAAPLFLVLIAWVALIYDRRRRDKQMREVIALNLVMEEGMSMLEGKVVSGADEKEQIKVGERQADGDQMSPGLRESVSAICFATPFL